MTALDAQRWIPEPTKDSGYGRTPYQRDRARVLHSAGFRRLAAKTQVHTAGSDDFLRTRLTHSLEVAQISREMGARLGCDPDVVDVAGLAHDLGHPPFGHNGETALDQVAEPCGGFEGNAQTLRVLTRLEAKVPGGGLNLTRASLDACSKYPWPRKPGTRKFGIYADDRPVFDWMRLAGLGERRCLEAQVMDWADDVAYSVHDVEDGVSAGRIDLTRLADPAEREAVALAAQDFSDESTDSLGAVLTELLAVPAVAAGIGHPPGPVADAAVKWMTSELTGRFATGAIAATRAGAGPSPLLRYGADLQVPRVLRAEVALLKAVARRYVMADPLRIVIQHSEQQLLTELVLAIADRGAPVLDPMFAASYLESGDDAQRLRVVLDQVSLLTDAQAVARHRRLTGGSFTRQ